MNTLVELLETVERMKKSITKRELIRTFFPCHKTLLKDIRTKAGLSIENLATEMPYISRMKWQTFEELGSLTWSAGNQRMKWFTDDELILLLKAYIALEKTEK